MPGDLWVINYPHMYSTINSKSLFGYRSTWFNSSDVNLSLSEQFLSTSTLNEGAKKPVDFRLNKDSSLFTTAFAEASLLKGNLNNSSLIN